MNTKLFGALAVLVVFTFSAENAFASRDCSANPNCGLMALIVGIIFWGTSILLAINIILKNPIKGTAKVLSYVFPFVLGFGLPIYLSLEFNFEGWELAAAWIGSWYIAYQYNNLHTKLFPEDDERPE